VAGDPTPPTVVIAARRPVISPMRSAGGAVNPSSGAATARAIPATCSTGGPDRGLRPGPAPRRRRPGAGGTARGRPV